MNRDYPGGWLDDVILAIASLCAAVAFALCGVRYIFMALWGVLASVVRGLKR